MISHVPLNLASHYRRNRMLTREASAALLLVHVGSKQLLERRYEARHGVLAYASSH
jgi:hypothetical protein